MEKEDAAMASLRLARPAGTHHMVITHPSDHPKSTDTTIEPPYCVTAGCVVCLRCSVVKTSLSVITVASISASIPTGTPRRRDAPPASVTRGLLD